MNNLAKNILKILIFVSFLGLYPLVLYLANQSPSFQDMILWLQQYQTIFLIALLFLKSISIIYPPLPGNLFTLGSIPIVGWEWAYAVDILGSTSGATISYFLGKKYGEPILRWAIGTRLTSKLTAIKIRAGNQIGAAFFLRLASGGMLSDGLSWGASLIKFQYRSFIIGYILSHLLTTLPVFYLLSLSISVKSWTIIVPTVFIAWFIIYKFKGRYFE